MVKIMREQMGNVYMQGNSKSREELLRNTSTQTMSPMVSLIGWAWLKRESLSLRAYQ